MKFKARSTTVVLLSALGLLVPASVGLGFLPGTGSPTLLAPLPILTVIPALLLDRLAYVALLLPSVLFLGWNPQLFRAEGRIPKRSYGLFVMATVLSVLYFALSWEDALKYSGLTYTVTVCLGSLGSGGDALLQFFKPVLHDDDYCRRGGLLGRGEDGEPFPVGVQSKIESVADAML